MSRTGSTRCAALALLAVSLGLGPAVATARAQSLAGPPTLGALYRDGQTNRYLLGGTWLYRADPAGTGLSQGWWRAGAATAGWTPTTVPNAFNAGDFSAAGFAGAVGWYRRDFTLPAGAFARYVPRAARRWIIRFESVNYRATVWLNGRRLGGHTGAYLPFELDAGTLRAGLNRLVVRVDSRLGSADLPPSSLLWWNFGGLLREVYLRPVQEADISQVRVRTLLPCLAAGKTPPLSGPRSPGAAGCPATIDALVTVRNPTGATATVILSGRYGRLQLGFGSARLRPGATWQAHASAVLAHPQLWTLGHPYLYRAVLSLNDAKGHPLSGYVTYSGVRAITVTSRGRLALNGRLLSLRGVSLHEQDVTVGAALDPGRLQRLVRWAKGLGATMIRAHYPLNPQLEELADRDGILVWSEVPVYHVNRSYLDQPAWLAAAHSFLQQDILTNQNHPSVAIWSIGNELESPPPAPEAGYIAGAAALAHSLDPTRPVGMALSLWPGLACQPAYAPLDVIGFNDYFGWYDSGGGATDDRDGLSSYLDSLRACYPTQAVMVTEFGFEARRSGPVEERGTYQFQADAAAYHLAVFAAKPWLSGALYFALQDFAVVPGWVGGDPWPDPPFLHKGLYDLAGAPKPAAAVVARIFRATVQIQRLPRAQDAGRRPGSPSGGR